MNSPPLYSPVRRVKPLPQRSKRRRVEGGEEEATVVITDESVLDAGSSISTFPHGGLSNFPMSYYLPIFAGQQANLRPDFDFHNHPVFAGPNATSNSALTAGPGANNGVGGANGGGNAGVASDDDDHPDPDYQDSRDRDQQGNTKKRKVPSTHRFKQDVDGYGNSIASSDGIPVIVDPDTLPTKGPAYGFRPHAQSSDFINWTAFTQRVVPAPISARPKKRGSRSRHLGKRIKDILKVRRRILAAVLGPVSLGDSLAVDQALTASLSWNLLTEERPFAKERELRKLVTPSKRSRIPPKGPHFLMPSSEFSFAMSSPTGERAVPLREEVAVLRDRFEGELARMATKRAIDMARKAAAAAKVAVENLSRDVKRSTRKKVSNHTGVGGENPNGNSSGRNPKKKKRSALANASNPHHLRNYVPSRVPSGGAIGGGSVAAAMAAQPSNMSAAQLENLLGPHPLRFLSAELKPRRSRRKDFTTPSSHKPEDEWICSFCEYNLFFGDDTAFRRAVKSRKKLLSRRRRARERAARTAAGGGSGRAGPMGSDTDDGSDEEEEESDVDPEDLPARFVDPAEVESRLEAGMKAILRDRDKLTGHMGVVNK